MAHPGVDGPPVSRQLRVREIIIDEPRQVAKLACRPGPLDAETVERIWTHLDRSFPPA